MIKAMDGWLNAFKDGSHKCFLAKWIIMLSTLACLSCGKKITDKNRNKKSTPNSLPAQNYPETLSIKLKKLTKNLGGSKLFNKRAFIKLNDKIKVSEGQLSEADIFFHVQESKYEFSCHYKQEAELKADYLYLEECRDSSGNFLSYMVPGKEIFIPADEEIYIEGHALNTQNALVQFEVLRK